MKSIVKLITLVVFLGLVLCVWCQEDVGTNSAGVYMVTLKQAPSVFLNYRNNRVKKMHNVGLVDINSGGANTLENPR